MRYIDSSQSKVFCFRFQAQIPRFALYVASFRRSSYFKVVFSKQKSVLIIVSSKTFVSNISPDQVPPIKIASGNLFCSSFNVAPSLISWVEPKAKMRFGLISNPLRLTF